MFLWECIYLALLKPFNIFQKFSVGTPDNGKVLNQIDIRTKPLRSRKDNKPKTTLLGAIQRKSNP